MPFCNCNSNFVSVLVFSTKMFFTTSIFFILQSPCIDVLGSNLLENLLSSLARLDNNYAPINSNCFASFKRFHSFMLPVCVCFLPTFFSLLAHQASIPCCVVISFSITNSRSFHQRMPYLHSAYQKFVKHHTLQSWPDAP